MNNREENETRNPVDLDSLINELKKKDDRQKTTYRRFYIMLSVFVVFYLLLLVVNPDPELPFVQRISGLLYVLAFIIGAWLFRREHRMIVTVNYADPLLKVLKNAVERYRPFSKRILPFLLFLLLINLGIVIGGPMDYLPGHWTNMQRIWIFQVVYWGIMLISAMIGYLIWRVRYRPLWLALKQMIDELEGKEE